MTSQTIGIIGLGLLGGALAQRLLDSGRALIGYDIDPARLDAFRAMGGQPADSAAAVSEVCDTVLLSLPTTDVVEAVIAQVDAHLRPGLIIIDTTTGEPERTARLGERLARRGVHYLDATVSGSSAEARKGNVVVMAGGGRAAFDACEDIFRSFAKQWFHVGPCGSGARMKLVVNLVLGLNRAVLAEGLALAERAGLDPALALEILKAGAAYSRAMDHKGERMLRRDFTPQARLSQHLKDVRLILAMGEGAGAKLPLSALHKQLLEGLEAAGLGHADNSAIIKAFE
jgi:3-hydroxyisobutyrate dehydrogenase-like beta-hydroxyacid dehydrogenase